MIRIFKNASYDFIRYWKTAAIVSGALVVLAFVTFAISGGVRYSIEFTGGTLMQLSFKTPPDVSDIRSAVEGTGIGGAEITRYGEATEFTIRAQDEAAVEEQDAGAEGIAKRIEAALVQQFGADEVTIVRTEAVGPKVGAELRRGAIIAMIIAWAISLIYLAIRYDWRFGTAAVLSLVHDVILTVAFIKIANIEVSLTVVAAILTVLGYSSNDTIIIFDRVRENLRKNLKLPLYDVINRSINETLGRSVMTHVTTLMATLALLIFAGPVLRPFSLVVTFGIIGAVYSSMYIAAPLLLYIEHKYPRDLEDKNARAIAANAPKAGTRKVASAH